MIVSIDVGTSYSSICMLGADGRPVPVDISTGASMYGSKYSLPSAVFVEDDGNILVGQAAMNNRKRKPQNFRMEFKRDLGQDIPIVLGNESFLPEDFYTELFRHMIASVAKVSSEAIEKACVTCPAAFGKKKREKVLKAANAAGLFCVELVDEPTAAAMSFAEDGVLNGDKKLMIYDFGGGTFDVSLLSYQSGSFALLTEPSGLERCGGIDMDRIIYSDMLNCIDGELLKKISADPKKNMRLMAQLSELAVKAKHHLSTATVFEEYIEIGMDDVEYKLTIDRFNTMIAGLVGQTMDICKNIVKNANLKISDLSAILMVGGTSRVPLVQSMVHQLAGQVPVYCSQDLDLAVARGALKFVQSGAKAPKNSAALPEAKAPENSEIQFGGAAVTAADHDARTANGAASAGSGAASPEKVGGVKNGGTATEVSRASAVQENLSPTAQKELALGIRYLTGDGVPKNYTLAVAHLGKAAHSGSGEAAWYLGSCWEQGKGVSVDNLIAKRWYEKAEALGAPKPELLKKPAGAGKHTASPEKVDGTNDASGKDATPAQPSTPTQPSKPAPAKKPAPVVDAGRADYEAGLRCEKENSFVKALMLYQSGAEKGCMDAYVALGRCYKEGLGISKDPVLAAQMFRKAAENAGNTEAMVLLGECYEKGQGVSLDNAQARLYYAKAAAAGSVQAKERMKNLEKRESMAFGTVYIAELVSRFIAKHPAITRGKGKFSESKATTLRFYLNVPAGETLLLAHDDTLFGTGKNGFILTNRGIYTKELMEKMVFISWREFIDGKVDRAPELSNAVLCNGKKIGYYTNMPKEIKSFWPELQSYLRQQLKE